MATYVHKIELLGIVMALLSSQGCYPAHPQPWGYLLDWSPDAITSWAMKQKDDREIFDASMAMLYIVGDPHKSEADAAKASRGLCEIQQKLIDGWLGYTGFGDYTTLDRA